ncbi:MAG: hypothetical protein AAFV19_16870 [Pseudomonadota bacterium]
MTASSLRLSASAFVFGAMALGAPAATAATLSPDPRFPFRVVLDYLPPSGWLVQQYETYVELKFTGVEFDVAPTPDLLDEMEGSISDVSSEVRSGSTYLRLTFGCECVPAIAASGEGQLNIDIVDLPSQSSPTSRRTIDSRVGAAPLVAPKPPIKAGSTKPSVRSDQATIDVDEARERLISQLLRAAEAGLVELAPDAEPLADEAAPPDIDQENTAAPTVRVPTDEELIDRVSSAAAAGEDILESISSAATGPQENGAAGLTSESEPRSAVTTATTATAGDSLSGQKAQTNGPKDASLADASPILEAEPKCYENSVFDFSEFSAHSALPDKISALRRSLVGEFDRADSAQAIALVKLYIYSGFTAEAREILKSFAKNDELAPIYMELSHLRDGDPLPETSSIRKQDCVGEQALWRAYAEALQGDGEEAVRSELAAGRALERLPVELREHVAATIGNAAAENGDWDSARRMEAIMARAATSMPKMSGRGHLLSAKLSFWNDEARKGIDHLRNATVSDPTSAKEALFALAEMALRDPDWERSRTENLRDDLGALARMLGDTKEGQRAFELEVKLANRVQSHGESMQLLSHGVETGLVEEDRQYELLTEVVTDPASDPNDQPLAFHYLEDPSKFEPALAQPGFRSELARSMMDLVVPRLAMDVLQPEDFEDTDLALSLANALVDAGAEREAMEVIAKLPDGSEKSRLLAETSLNSGNPDQAVAHLEEALPDISDASAQIEALLSKADAAQLAGDTPTAISALEEVFQLTPSDDLAKDIAMLALADGRNDMPAQVREHLAAESPAVLAGLEPLFGLTGPPADLTTPEGVDGYLERLDAEEAAIQELLTNG